MHEKVLSHYEHYTVGEVPHAKDPSIMLNYVNPDRHELKTSFSFDLHDVDGDQQWPLKPKPFSLVDFKAVVNKWTTYFHAHNGWLTAMSENHDQARTVSRWASDHPAHRKQAAKLLAMFQVGQSGTQYIYQGQELGMKNVPPEWPMEEYLDVATINFYNHCKQLTAAGKTAPGTPDEVRAWAQRKARDNARTPVQWDSGPHAGFTTGSKAPPWMRVQEDDARAGWNAADEAKDPTSVLCFWRQILRLRKQERALIYGNFNLLFPEDEQLFAFVRNLDGHNSVLVLLNFSDTSKDVTIRSDEVQRAQDALPVYKSAPPLADLANWRQRCRVLLHNYPGELQWQGDDGLRLQPYQGAYLALQ